MNRPTRGIDPESPTPLYHQIYLLYRQKIMSGTLVYGELLPSEDELSNLYAVSRITAKRAMNELAQDGLVTRTRGRGTLVVHKARPTTMSADFDRLMENLQTIDATTSIEVLTFDYVAPPLEVQDALSVPAQSLVQRVERRRMRDGEPFSHILTYLPEEIGRSFDVGDLSNRPILALVEASGHRIASARQIVTAVLADPHLAGHLATPIGAPLLQVRRVVRDTDERPVQHITIHYRPEIYQLSMSLDRVRDAGTDRFVWA
ncbi:GntR family transcriptional regulator [Acuticoccus sediminis]|nr:GntR family transcriptional regulator [Acuticoccus sediminis]